MNNVFTLDTTVNSKDFKYKNQLDNLKTRKKQLEWELDIIETQIGFSKRAIEDLEK